MEAETNLRWADVAKSRLRKKLLKFNKTEQLKYYLNDTYRD